MLSGIGKVPSVTVTSVENDHSWNGDIMFFVGFSGNVTVSPAIYCACTGDITVVKSEAKRPHEMKRHAQPHAEAAYRPRVMWDFRAKKDD